jgi:hypothetical protein
MASPRQLSRAEYHRHLNAVDDWIELAETEGNADLLANLDEYRAKVVADWHAANPMPDCGGATVCPRAARHHPYPCPCGGHLTQQQSVARHLEDYE